MASREEEEERLAKKYPWVYLYFKLNPESKDVSQVIEVLVMLAATSETAGIVVRYMDRRELWLQQCKDENGKPIEFQRFAAFQVSLLQIGDILE